MPARPALVVVSSVSEAEVLVPIVTKLASNHSAHFRVLLYKKVAKRRPDLLRSFTQSRANVLVWGTVRWRLQRFVAIMRASALMQCVDPNLRPGRWKPINVLIRLLRKPVLFVQHGFPQAMLSHIPKGSKQLYYSQSLLLWPPGNSDISRLPVSKGSRIREVPFPKRPLAPYKDLRNVAAGWRERFDHVLAVCIPHENTPPQEGAPSLDEVVRNLFSALAQYPRTGLILRGHRGLPLPKLIEKSFHALPNAIEISTARDEDAAGTRNLIDLLTQCDAVISGASTVLLDALYLGKRTAKLAFGHAELFTDVRQLKTKEDFVVFLNELEKNPHALKPLKKDYGDGEAAKFIAEFLNSKAESSP